ncbi:hypothetical protein [Muribaculum intestinale]|uniref:hypothetical protein n=1 Tax=Muribaculum intestinale TaxID=1796646 RepID=UPI0012903260|nr:hypothetical protein [Muribaculum intestinale]QQR08575.1 hypothetical protein I5Q90_11280 [Muribaculum intestinale]
MRIVKLSLLIAICLLCMTACRFHVLDGPVIPWKIENRSEIRITMITGYGGEDYFVPSDFVSQAIITMPPMTRHQAYRNNAHDLDTELKLHSNIEFHFLLEDRSEINSIDISTVKKSMAYFRLNKQWMNDHNWTIIFPDDCTVNPDLWKICDLDAFVEKYGPLKAKGWDEVWQKWEENKRTGEVETEMAEFPPLYCE